MKYKTADFVLPINTLQTTVHLRVEGIYEQDEIGGRDVYQSLVST